jgi:hypothetical protein
MLIFEFGASRPKILIPNGKSGNQGKTAKLQDGETFD